MIYIVVCVRDRAAVVYGQPFVVAARGQAIRSFSDEINSGKTDSALASHPEDFDLFELGTYNDEGGLFDTGVPKQIAVGKDLKLPKNGS